MSKTIKDPILDYYRKITKSDFLHYGLWNSEDELNIENLYIAQERYINHLISFIPENVKTILDVGCGIGGNALQLLEKEFSVEALSPDIAQEAVFLGKGKIPFHLTKFEDFHLDKKYDLILMSESAQYIPIEAGFEKCLALLNQGGYLLVSDYFFKGDLSQNNVFAICTHQKYEYLATAKKYGFEIVESNDITPRITPTLDLAMSKYKEYVLPTLELLDDLISNWIPIPYKVIKYFAHKPYLNLMSQLQLIDSQLFLQNRQYMIYLFKSNSSQ